MAGPFKLLSYEIAAQVSQTGAAIPVSYDYRYAPWRIQY